MYSEEFKTNVVKDIMNGMPIKVAARTYKIERHTVQKWVRRANGEPVIVNHWKSPEEKLQILKEVEEGMSIAKAAKTFNISEQTIRNWIDKRTELLAINSVQGNNFSCGTESLMARENERDIKLQNRSLKQENEYLKAKVAYLEKLMELSNVPAKNFKKKQDMKPLTESLKAESQT